MAERGPNGRFGWTKAVGMAFALLLGACGFGAPTGAAPGQVVLYGDSLAAESAGFTREAAAPAAWVADVTGARVVSSTRPSGGVSSRIDFVVLTDRDGARREVVLRRIAYDATWHPDPIGEARREAEMLEPRAGCPHTPALLATDLAGGGCGLAAVLATRLPGEPLVAPDDVDARVNGLADAVRSVRSCLTSTSGLLGFKPCFTVADDAPAWTTVPGAWRVLRERIDAGRFRGTAPGGVGYEQPLVVPHDGHA